MALQTRYMISAEQLLRLRHAGRVLQRSTDLEAQRQGRLVLALAEEIAPTGVRAAIPTLRPPAADPDGPQPA